VRRGDVDPARVVIRGGSAGGYTTLCALTFHADVFAAGASHFGIGDLEDFGRETHKFESRYLESLVGPPDDVERYRARSPIRFADLLSRPVILFQGLEDAVVPPAQAEAIVGVLEARRLPYAYLAFEGEQHGFRRSSTIERVLEAELAFYGAVLGFDPAGDIEPIDVRNLG
jgi:dipeptidyl aminopeptidase/acylaminoacyl peptidase